MEMPKIDAFWDEQLVNPAHGGHRHAAVPSVPQPIGSGGGGGGGAHSQYERNLNFATVAVEDGDYGFPKKKTVRDPLSHRIIEKRRRDRMNNCLADLARLLPPSSLRKGRGRIEKTEIVELAIKHLRHLQCHPCPMGEKCEFSGGADNSSGGGGGGGSGNNGSPTASCSSSSTSSGYHSSNEEQFRLGFQECLSEAMHFLVEQEGLYAGDATCVRLVKHLNNHCETVMRDHWGNPGKIVPGFRRNAADSGQDFKKTGSGASSSSGYHPNGSSSGSDGNGGNDGEGTEAFVLPVQNNPPHHLNMDGGRLSSNVLNYEEENSCSSTPLSIETSDVLSCDGKNNSAGRMSSKPPIPTIICSHSSSNNSGSPATGSNGRSSDDGSANSSTSFAHRYKFKSNIKQRFTADCQTVDDRTCFTQGGGSGGGGGNKDDGMEADRDLMDASSDTEEIRDEGISVSVGESGGEELESGGKSIAQGGMVIRRGSLAEGGGKTAAGVVAQISNAGGVAPSSSSCTLEKTGLSSTSGPLAVVAVGNVKPVTTQELENPGNRDASEVKPSAEELLSAIHSLSTPGAQNKSQLPALEGSEDSGKGVPAFALHEKGLFYVPLTIDKSIVSRYTNKFDTSASIAPPLYPVTISVCFLLGPEKVGKAEMPQESDMSTVDCDTESTKVAAAAAAAGDFSRPSTTPIPLPLTAASLMKRNRNIHRESNNFLQSRYSHHHHHHRGAPYKESNHHNRALGSSMFNHAAYQDGHSSTCSPSPVPTMTDLSRCSEESEFIHLSGGGSRCSSNTNTTGGGGGNSSSTSSSGGGTRGRKRSVSISPSVSGGTTGSAQSIGYHSWSDKASPAASPHDFFNNFHSNTQHLPSIALHGHLAAAAAAAAASSGSLIQRHGQALSNFHSENGMLREKEATCFGQQERRTKKSRSMDQSLELIKQ